MKLRLSTCTYCGKGVYADQPSVWKNNQYVHALCHNKQDTMLGVISKIKYETEDGLVFDNRQNCIDHENEYNEMIKEKYGSMYELRQHIGSYGMCTFENGGIYCNKFIETVKAFRKFEKKLDEWIKYSEKPRHERT